MLREERKQELRAERGLLYREPVSHNKHRNRHKSKVHERAWNISAGTRDSDPIMLRTLGCGQYPDIRIRGRAQSLSIGRGTNMGAGSQGKVRFVTAADCSHWHMYLFLVTYQI